MLDLSSAGGQRAQRERKRNKCRALRMNHVDLSVLARGPHGMFPKVIAGGETQEKNLLQQSDAFGNLFRVCCREEVQRRDKETNPKTCHGPLLLRFLDCK